METKSTISCTIPCTINITISITSKEENIAPDESLPGNITNLLPINSSEVSEGDTLSWTFGDNTEEYQLLLDKNPNPTTVIIPFTSILENSFLIDRLDEGDTYYWKIIAKNQFGETESQIMNFSTAVLTPISDVTISAGNIDYLKDKRAIATALIDPSEYTIETSVEYADTANFISPIVITGETMLPNTGEQMAIFLLPKLPIGKKYLRIKATNGTIIKYSAVHEIITYPGTGRNRVQTDYSTRLANARALYTGNDYYIDPTAVVNGNGRSEATPFNSWASVPFHAVNRRYYQKAGTTVTLNTFPVAFNTNSAYIGTYGGTARAKIITTTNPAYYIESRAKLMLENLEIEGTNKDANGLFTGVGIRLRNSADSIIHNCVVHGFGNAITGNPVNGTNGASWRGFSILHTEVYDCNTDGMYFDDVTGVEVGHCYIHHVNLAYHYSTDELVSPGDGIQAAFTEVPGGDFLELNVHHTTIDRSDSGNKFCLIWGSGSLYRHCEIDVEYNEFIINENNQSCIYTDTVLVGYANVSNNDFYGSETGVGHGIYNRHTATAPLTAENNIFKGLGLVLNNAYGRADITKNTFINNAIAFSVYTDGYDIKFNRNIVIGDENSRLIYGTQTEKLVESNYNCYNMPTILTSAPTLLNYQTLLGMDVNSINTDADLDIDYTLKSTSPCVNLGGDYVGAYEFIE